MVITLKEMLAQMDSGKTFSIRFISHDSQRPLRNGRTIEYQEARLEKAVRSDDDDRIFRSKKVAGFKRTIRLYANGRPTQETRSFHPILVEMFDNKELLL